MLDHQRLAQITINELQEHKNSLKSQIEDFRQKHYEAQSDNNNIDEECLKMKLSEDQQLQEIERLRQTLESMLKTQDDHKAYFKSEAEVLLKYSNIAKVKQDELDGIESHYQDENEIKNVLMLRIRGKRTS